MRSLLWRFSGPGVVTLVGLGLDIGNFEIRWVSYVLFGVAGLWAAWALFTLSRDTKGGTFHWHGVEITPHHRLLADGQLLLWVEGQVDAPLWSVTIQVPSRMQYQVSDRADPGRLRVRYPEHFAGPHQVTPLQDGPYAVRWYQGHEDDDSAQEIAHDTFTKKGRRLRRDRNKDWVRSQPE